VDVVQGAVGVLAGKSTESDIMKSLVVGNAVVSIDNIAAAQLAPFFRCRSELDRKLGFKFDHVQAVSIAEIEQACLQIATDIQILFIRPDWREDPDQVVQVVQKIRQAHPQLKIFFIDPWDQVSSRFFGVLPYVDKLLKYQRLKDVKQYRQPFAGGTVITDYLARQGYDLHGWHVGSEVPPGYEDRIGVGWNVAVARRMERMLFRPLAWRLVKRQFRRKPKDIDVFCHLSYGSIDAQESWCTQYRMAAIAAARSLDSSYKLAVSGEFPEARTVSAKQYQDEIQRSRIVFSPFGWGETTWRDYEAVCHDCLLIKPQIDHIETTPNIYYPGDTYVSVRWDFADLAEKCDYYLHNPDEAARIITNARRVLESYFKQGEFVKTIAALLSDTPVSIPGVPALRSKTVTSPIA